MSARLCKILTILACANCTWGKTAINCSLPGVQEGMCNCPQLSARLDADMISRAGQSKSREGGASRCKEGEGCECWQYTKPKVSKVRDGLQKSASSCDMVMM